MTLLDPYVNKLKRQIEELPAFRELKEMKFYGQLEVSLLFSMQGGEVKSVRKTENALYT